MTGYVALPLSEHYSSQDPNLFDKMGPMRFPILDSALELGYGTYWTVSRMRYPTNSDQLAAAKALISGRPFKETVDPDGVVYHQPVDAAPMNNIVIANANKLRITIVRGDFNLVEMGLHIYQDACEDEEGNIKILPGKESKRIKAFTRPFRIHTRRNQLNVLVVDPRTDGLPDHLHAQKDSLYDGASLISDRIVDECISNLCYSDNKYFQYDSAKKWFGNQKVFNGVLIGNLVDVETGRNLKSMGKGQYIRTTLPEGIDVITSKENLKNEIVGYEIAWVGIEPQTAKAAREDQQTVTNHWHFCTAKDAQERLAISAKESIDHVFSGKFRKSTSELVYVPNAEREGPYNHTSFNNLLAWRVNNFMLHGGSYLDSPWLTEKVANLWTKKLGYQTPRWETTLKIPILNGIRAQVVCKSLIDLFKDWSDEHRKENTDIEDGQIRWFAPLKMAYVSDNDWIETVIPSHGGCDQDDFFSIRWFTETSTQLKKVIINRSPNARGEYSVWNYVKGDWYQSYTVDGKKKSFPKMDIEQLPTQILEAIDNQIVQYLPLPSQSAIKPDTFKVEFSKTSCFADIEESMEIEGGYGQYELVVRARNSTDQFSFDSIAINSEDAVDAFAQVGTVEDREFILQDRDRVKENLLIDGHPIDSYIIGRIGIDQKYVQPNYNGPIATVKHSSAKVIQAYKNQVSQKVSQLTEPSFVAELGDNEHYYVALDLLKFSRNRMWQNNSSSTTPDERQVVESANVDQGDMLVQWVDEYANGNLHVRHAFMLAFWHACWTKPTSHGKITDQPIFGTGLFDYLVEAMVYYGLLNKPKLTSLGNIVHEPSFVEYKGNKIFECVCVKCDKEVDVDFKHLHRYHEADGICKKCR